MSEDVERPESQKEEQPQDHLVTLGELLEARRIRFMERVRELQKKGELK